jgi:hypothetical protein
MCWERYLDHDVEQPQVRHTRTPIRKDEADHAVLPQSLPSQPPQPVVVLTEEVASLVS